MQKYLSCAARSMYTLDNSQQTAHILFNFTHTHLAAFTLGISNSLVPTSATYKNIGMPAAQVSKPRLQNLHSKRRITY
jgi:hypothetical protein